jgi:hypothetical protein
MTTTAAVTTDDSPGNALQSLIRDNAANPQRIRDFLDGLPEADRIAATRSLGRGVQRRLWDLVDGFGELTLDDFVPKGTPVMTAVRHYGRNTMPAFKLFEKRFYLTSDGQQMAGANFQTIQAITGPGYFVCREDTNKREVLIDYHLVPTEKPEGFFPIRRNEVGLSRFIYAYMIDRMRRVSTHVTIGRANRHGKDFGAWFMLCREASR